MLKRILQLKLITQMVKTKDSIEAIGFDESGNIRIQDYTTAK